MKAAAEAQKYEKWNFIDASKSPIKRIAQVNPDFDTYVLKNRYVSTIFADPVKFLATTFSSGPTFSIFNTRSGGFRWISS